MDMEAVLRPPSQPPPPPRRFIGDGKGERKTKTPLVIGEESLGRARPYYVRRCKRMRSTSIECLPNELLSDILARLPADYLHDRARLVCRRWYRIICSDAFVNKQFQHSTCGLLLSGRTRGDIHPIFMTATQGRVKTNVLGDEFRNRIVNGCNGLAVEMCHGQEYSPAYVTIMNPATKQSLVLPPLQRAGVPYDCFCCIAFAASSMKYKLVMPYWNTWDMVLAILTVGVDNSWRDVEIEHVPERVRPALADSAYITEGFMHWTSNKASVLLTLDVETEMLTLKHAPRPRGHIGVYHLSTGIFLSLLVGFRDFLLEIWGMNSETGEWRKVLPDIKLGGLLDEFAATGNNEALRALLDKFASNGKDEVLVPLGWVKYPEILAFRNYARNKIQSDYGSEQCEEDDVSEECRSKEKQNFQKMPRFFTF